MCCPGPKGPGVILVFKPIDRIVRVSLRIDTLEVPAQDVITRDNVTVKVNAVIYFRVIDPRLAVVEVTNFLYATSQLAQTTLRSVLGEVELDELLSKREMLNLRLQEILDQHTAPWGVKVTMVEVKQVDLAESMIRAIARQAEAERERRAKIINAEGEYTAAEKLGMAAAVIQKEPDGVAVALSADARGTGDGKEYNDCLPSANRYNFNIGTRAWIGLPVLTQGLRTAHLTYAEKRDGRIRIGAGQPTVAQRICGSGDPVWRVLRDGIYRRT